ncbi:MAG: hypothetical protein CVT49_08325 [candidate division Zixibacteria bacterium HGW-Zixibacteria-1]|nr:MAG: hypothetical protein CVT49_08325 [candidate division Zixibacteria bacterium HGW-Zixibacteria-1]
MRKKILVAEKSDAIRSIAESILHQNGYDVITASTVEKAKELIITSQPNMVIVGADMRDAQEAYLYDTLEESENTSSIPILLIADPEGRSLPYPDEVILPRPFDPKDFLERVRLFVGGGIEEQPEEKIEAVEPLSMEAVDDEFLDAALGIDRIEVEESEIMDKTSLNMKPDLKLKAPQKDIFEIHRPEEEKEKNGMNDSDRVESLMIRDEPTKKEPVEENLESDFSSSSKLEIASDQYGLMEPDQLRPDKTEQVDSDHDYRWFIKEMQKETTAPAKYDDDPQSGEDSELITRSTRDSVEPINIPSSKSHDSSLEEFESEPSISPGGVDEFISEFKKEVQNISSGVPEDPSGQPEETTVAVAEEMQPASEREFNQAEIHHFVNNLVDVLSEKLAKKIIEKIDKEELYRIIKEDMAGILSLKKRED